MRIKTELLINRDSRCKLVSCTVHNY